MNTHLAPKPHPERDEYSSRSASLGDEYSSRSASLYTRFDQRWLEKRGGGPPLAYLARDGEVGVQKVIVCKTCGIVIGDVGEGGQDLLDRVSGKSVPEALHDRMGLGTVRRGAAA